MGPSDYLPNRIAYEVSIFDTTGNINVNMSHELVYAGIASGSLECLQVRLFLVVTRFYVAFVQLENYSLYQNLCYFVINSFSNSNLYYLNLSVVRLAMVPSTWKVLQKTVHISSRSKIRKFIVSLKME